MDFTDIIPDIIYALSYLFLAVIAYFIWKMAYKETVKNGFLNVLIYGFVFCLVISVLGGWVLRSPNCIDMDYTETYCIQYADDGYISPTERGVTKFIYFITFLYVPTVVGAFSGKLENEKKDKLKKEDDTII